MNEVKAKVVEILTEPTQNNYGWEIKVRINIHGSKRVQKLHRETKEEIENIEVGHTFLT